MSSDIFVHSSNAKYNSSAEPNDVKGNLSKSRSTLSTTGISIIILTMCMCGRIVTSNAELPGKVVVNLIAIAVVLIDVFFTQGSC